MCQKPILFKPVLNFLESTSRGILIADEVGLGKTIEAGLIWTELRARFDASKLLIICPAMLRDKWKAELAHRFGIRADICNAKELLSTLEEHRVGMKEDFAIICSFQGLRPPSDWQSEANEKKATACLARFFEENEAEYLELEINYSNVTNPEEDFITEKIDPTNKEYNYINAIINNNSTFLTNLDYSKPINNGTIELGLESRVQRNFNKITTNQEIESSGNQSTNSVGNSELTYNRKTYSAYINLNKEYSKINIQTGIRLEQFNLVGVFSNTQQANIEPIKNQIFNIYPSVHITYLPSDKNQFQIGFSRRVDRPSITQVTPIQEWNSPLSISMGNRNLVPQYTNSIELNYSKTISKGYISLGTFYRKTKNIIGRIFNTDASNTDRQILSYTNYDSAESYGFEFSSRFKPLKWWTLRPSANLYIQDNQGFINNILSETNNTFFKARISNNLKASDRLRFSFSTSYRGKNQSVLAKIEDYFLVNIAAKYYILNKNGAISLRGTDIFDGYKLDFTTTNPFSQTGQFTLEYSAIYLGFSYNFGNGKNRERDRKYREENETQSSGGVL